ARDGEEPWRTDCRRVRVRGSVAGPRFAPFLERLMNARPLGLLLACFLLILGVRLPGGPTAAVHAAADPPEVTVSQPLVREVTDQEEFAGRTEAVASVEIRARVNGTLEKVAFRPGTSVKQGDLLFEIDPRLYQAELDKATAEVQRAEGRFKRANADLE